MYGNRGVIVHHGGLWEVISKLKYVGGSSTTYDNLPNEIDATFIRTLIELLGHEDVVKIYWVDPWSDMETGTRFLHNDDSFAPLIDVLNLGVEIHIYCEHGKNLDISDADEVEGIIDLDQGERVSFTELLGMQLSNNVAQIRHAPPNSNAVVTRNALSSCSEIDYDESGSDIDDDELTNARLEIQNAGGELERLEIELGRDRTEVDSDYEGESDLDNRSEEDEYGYIAPPLVTHKRKRGVVYRDTVRPEETAFSLDQVFDSAKQFRSELRNYSVCNGFEVEYTKNHRDKIGVKCKTEGCQWRIWPSIDKYTKSFTVKTHFNEHSHGRQWVVSKICYKWVAEKYASKFKINPSIKVADIVEWVKLDFGLVVSTYLAYNAKKLAITNIFGEYKEQYELLNEYAVEIMKSNPKNNVKFKLESNVFQRMYIGFDALIQGFKAGCRPFLSIDGCFLKGPYGGQLLVAVGKDGNNQMFPIAWAVVESESEDSWCWFLGLLADDLGTIDGAGYVVMSDQQKGLLNGVDVVFPAAEKRCCARHIYMNFRGIFGGNNEYRKWFWRAAKSTTEVQFKENLKQLNLLCPAAVEDLLTRNPEKWCRAYYTYVSTCDNVDNNMSEVFNAYILKSRYKPIISMLEDIRESLMERLHNKRDYLANKNVSVCPRIQKQLEKAKLDARGWSAYWNGDYDKWTYNVKDGISQDKHVVHLLEWTCTCNSWQLNGVPCNHAVAAIWHNKEDPEKYLSEYYLKFYYLKAYQFILDALRGPKQWEKSEMPPIQAPTMKKVKAQRPTTARRKSVGEESTTKSSKQGQHQTCFYCGQSGHNKKKCKLDYEKKARIMEEKEKAEATKKSKWEERLKKAQARKIQKAAHKEQALKERVQSAAAPNRPQGSTPMHNRGFGQLTYPNGFSRPATMPRCERSPQQTPQSPPRRNVAVYSDFEGSQTLRSVTPMHDRAPMVSSQSGSSSTTPIFLDPKGRPSISSQALRELAQNRASAMNKNKGKSCVTFDI